MRYPRVIAVLVLAGCAMIPATSHNGAHIAPQRPAATGTRMDPLLELERLDADTDDPAERLIRNLRHACSGLAETQAARDRCRNIQ